RCRAPKAAPPRATTTSNTRQGWRESTREPPRGGSAAALQGQLPGPGRQGGGAGPGGELRQGGVGLGGRPGAGGDARQPGPPLLVGADLEGVDAGPVARLRVARLARVHAENEDLLEEFLDLVDAGLLAARLVVLAVLLQAVVELVARLGVGGLE